MGKSESGMVRSVPCRCAQPSMIISTLAERSSIIEASELIGSCRERAASAPRRTITCSRSTVARGSRMPHCPGNIHHPGRKPSTDAFTVGEPRHRRTDLAVPRRRRERSFVPGSSPGAATFVDPLARSTAHRVIPQTPGCSLGRGRGEWGRPVRCGRLRRRFRRFPARSARQPRSRSRAPGRRASPDRPGCADRPR